MNDVALSGDARQNLGHSEADDDGDENHQELEQAHRRSYC
jgi:hypothetical protein